MLRALSSLFLVLPLTLTPLSDGNNLTGESKLLEDFLIKHNVSQEMREIALEKLKAGETLDSEKTDSQPIKINEQKAADEITKVFYYKDGSVKTSTFPSFSADRPVTSFYRVSNCIYSGASSFGASWTNCYAQEQHYYGYFGIYFNYDYARNGKQSISKYWTPMCNSQYGHNNLRVERISGTQIRVRAELKTDRGGSQTRWMDVIVDKGQASTTAGGI